MSVLDTVPLLNTYPTCVLFNSACLLPTGPLPTLHCSLPLVACPHHSLNVPSYVKVAFELHTQRITRLHEIFKNYVDHVLVKNFNVPERVDIEFQTLELNAELMGNIVKSYSSEIREVRERADGSELRNFEADRYLAPGEFVGESSERIERHFLARRGADIKALLVGSAGRFT